MKQVCKSCGKEFSLSQGEIDFYITHNLSLPKRCSECRKANKNHTTIPYDSQDNYDIDTSEIRSREDYVDEPPEKPKDSGIVRIILIILIAGALLFAGGKGIRFLVKGSNPKETAAYLFSEDVAPTTDTTTVAVTNTTAEKVSPVYHFRNDDALLEHFDKHGQEFDYSTPQEYEKAASDVINSENALHKTEAEDGDDVYYLESSNEFVILSTDGYIRTYFKPDSEIEYYNSQ